MSEYPTPVEEIVFTRFRYATLITVLLIKLVTCLIWDILSKRVEVIPVLNLYPDTLESKNRELKFLEVFQVLSNLKEKISASPAESTLGLPNLVSIENPLPPVRERAAAY